METSAARASRYDRREVVPVPIMKILPGDSPRLNGEDKQHIRRLAETEAELPPILVDRQTMKVIDGMHRLTAASLRGDETITVVFFDGSEADVFLRAVEENISHGLPLSQADRTAAAERIIESHPQMSDRAIAQSAGLAAKTVAVIRRRLSGDEPQLNARVGKDGRVRPLDSSQARQRAAEILAQRPQASLREVAKQAGISPATVLDVRNRIERGEPPVPVGAVTAQPEDGGRRDGRPPGRPGTGRDEIAADRAATIPPAPRRSPEDTAQPPAPHWRNQVPEPTAVIDRLMRDPSLRGNENGRQLLRLLQATAAGASQLPAMMAAIPPHRVAAVAHLARRHAQSWQEFATELSRRARIIDPDRTH